MESLTNSVEDYLVDGLSFKLPLTSSYIQNRTKSTFWASGSNVYKPLQGTKVVRFQLSGQDGTWLDPSTVRIQFDLVNNEAGTETTLAPQVKRIRPLTGAHIFFKRARVLVNGAIAEDLQEYNRFHEMMDSMQPDNVRDNTDSHGFGNRWDDKQHKYPANENDVWTVDSMPGISPGKKQTVCFKPFFGLTNQSKLLPIKYAPIFIELEIVNNNTDAIISPDSKNIPDSGAAAVFTAANTGTDWSIENICIKCDLCTLDNNLNNEYTAHLLSGKSLPITYTTYTNQQSTIVTKPVAVQVARAFTRLQKAFITFYKNPTIETILDKPAIKFYHPMEYGVLNGKYKHNPAQELELQLQLGSKLYPEYPVRSISECFSILKQTLNIPYYHMHSVGIDYKQYISNKFIFAMDFQKMPEASFTGQSTKGGEQLLVKVNNVDSAFVGNEIANSMFITLASENIMEIRDTAVSIMD